MSRPGCLLNLFFKRTPTACPLNRGCYECYDKIRDRLEFPPSETDTEYDRWLEEQWNQCKCDRDRRELDMYAHSTD